MEICKQRSEGEWHVEEYILVVKKGQISLGDSIPHEKCPP